MTLCCCRRNPTQQDCCVTDEVDCTIQIDNFNRTNSSNLGDDWCEISGSWSINSNTLVCNTEGPVITTVRQPSPVDSANYSCRISFEIVDTASHWKIICKYIDEDNFDWVELFYVGSNIYPKFWQRVGGTDTLVMDPDDYPQGGSWTLSGGNVSLTICYSSLEWSIAGPGSFSWTICGGTPATSLSPGCLGLVGFLKGDFDNFMYQIHWESDHECGDCSCFCWDEEDVSCMPETLTLTMTPIVDHTDCTSNPDTHTWTLRQSLPTEPATPPPSYLASPEKRYWFSDPVTVFEPDYQSVPLWFRLECLGNGGFELILLEYPSGAQTAVSTFPSYLMQFTTQSGTNGGSRETNVVCDPISITFNDISKNLLQIGSPGPYLCNPFNAKKYSVVVTE